MFDEIRKSLIKEAQQSPKLLSDLAGLEEYIAESYSSRSFTELLQNADDAKATKFKIKRIGDLVFIANDGKKFNKKDFESLCRSANSSKVRGESIGYRGIGFKSVVGFSNIIHLISGKLKISFSKQLTKRLIPDADKVPLIRIPHLLKEKDYKKFKDEVESFLEAGYNTIFIFEDLINEELEIEFNNFDYTSLLFLNTVKLVDFTLDNKITNVSLERNEINEKTEEVRISANDDFNNWITIRENDIGIAFLKNKSGEIEKISKDKAVVHAFLPTEEFTGLGIKINGDISTDPSRRRVLLEKGNDKIIEKIANLIYNIFYKSLKDDISFADNKNILNAIIPYDDPRNNLYKEKTFSTELLNEIKSCANDLSESLFLRPKWLNPLDSEKIIDKSDIWILDRNLEEINGILPFLKFLGVKRVEDDIILNNINKVKFSIRGCAEIVAYFVNKFSIKQINLECFSENWDIWIDSEGQRRSFNELRNKDIKLKQEFIDLISEKINILKSLDRFIIELENKEMVKKVGLDSNKNNSKKDNKKDKIKFTSNNLERDPNTTVEKLSLEKWRSAEQQVLNILNYKGYNVKDVSKQHLGYDLEGINEKEEKVYVEVKSINYFGQSFTITNNEWAAAKEKGDKYILVIVQQDNNHIKLAFVKNPLNEIEVTRKCRQWVWECSEYNFDTQKIELD